MRVDVIDNIEQFRACRSQWDTLYDADPHAHFFLSSRWLEGVLGFLDKDWRILIVKQGEQLAAAMPLRVELYKSKRHGVLCNELLMPGRAFWADYTGFLCLSDSETQVIPALASALQSHRWAQLEMEHLRLPDHRLELFLESFDTDDFVIEERPRGKNQDGIDNDVCPAVDLADDFDTFLAEKLSSSTRMKLRRALRQVDNADDLRITESTPDTFERDVDILVSLWRQMWEQRKGDRIDSLTKRYRVILLEGLHAGVLYLPILWSGDTPVAALGNYIDQRKGVMHVKTTGRDKSWRKPPAGFVMHGHSIRWAITQGLTRYDFMRGDESYKYHYGSEDTRIRNVRIRTQSRMNLHGKLDPLSFADARRRAARYDRENRSADAVAVRQQIRDSGGEPREASIDLMVQADLVDEANNPESTPTMSGKTVYMMRGLPSCGKSTTAKKIAGEQGVICETDRYFFECVGDDPNTFDFDSKLMEQARQWNFDRFKAAVEEGRHPIVVDRGNSRNNESKRYVVFAREHGYDVVIQEPESKWWQEIRVLLKYKQVTKPVLYKWAEKLAEMNLQTHATPADDIKHIMDKWKWNLTVDDILSLDD